MVRLFALLVCLGTAQSQPSQGYSESQSSQGYSEGQSSQGYAEPAYAEPAYAEPAAYVKPVSYQPVSTQCFPTCPPESPCLDRFSRTCVHLEVQAKYSSAYGTQEYGQTYEAQDQQYEMPEQEQQNYRRLANSEGSCPAHTVDARCNALSSGTRHIVYWAGFIILFLAALQFYFRATWIRKTFSNVASQTKDLRGITVKWTPEDFPDDLNILSAYPTALCSAACLIAAVFYFIMALGGGSYVSCCTGRELNFLRYADWLFTTPLLLVAAIQFGLRLPELKAKLRRLEEYSINNNSAVCFLVVIDILMILAGFVGANTCGGLKWAFWGFAFICFVSILGFLFWNLRLVRRRKLLHYQRAPIFKKLFLVISFFWTLYPIAWVLADGTESLCVNVEVIVYLVLDIITKVLFGYLVAYTTLKRGFTL